MLKSSYSAPNAVLKQIGRIASEEVTLKIIRYKCILILIYGTEAFMLSISQTVIAWLCYESFVYETALIRTNNIETVEFCEDQFGFDKPMPCRPVARIVKTRRQTGRAPLPSPPLPFPLFRSRPLKSSQGVWGAL